MLANLLLEVGEVVRGLDLDTLSLEEGAALLKSPILVGSLLLENSLTVVLVHSRLSLPNSLA